MVPSCSLQMHKGTTQPLTQKKAALFQSRFKWSLSRLIAFKGRFSFFQKGINSLAEVAGAKRFSNSSISTSNPLSWLLAGINNFNGCFNCCWAFGGDFRRNLHTFSKQFFPGSNVVGKPPFKCVLCINHVGSYHHFKGFSFSHKLYPGVALPPYPGISPSETSGNPILALSLTTYVACRQLKDLRPAQNPFTAAIMGLLKFQ